MISESTSLLKPGMYEHVPATTYHAWDACSNSILSLVKRSPAHAVGSVRKETKTLSLGTAVHACVLEPEEFERNFLVEPDFGDCRSPKNKEKRDQWRAERVGKTFITREVREKCQRATAAVYAHPEARKLLHTNVKEVSLVWEDGPALCKARLDAVNVQFSTVIDVKTARDARPVAFEKSIFSFGYYRQGPWYLDAWEAVTSQRMHHYILVVVEPEPPYGVYVYRIEDDVLQIGRREMTLLLSRWKNCRKDDKWPGYPTGVHDVGIPIWAQNLAVGEIVEQEEAAEEKAA